MMLVRSVSVRNIRSYNDGAETSVVFPEGVTLLEGDVGSGKSSILYALEFALFGFSDMRGTYLLSEGKADGRVAVVVEVSGQAYKIERGLRRRGDEVFQENCFITTGGERTKLSPSDLKERVVSLLGYNEQTHPKAESLVYRYAVFTPQEQMKQILSQGPEERLQVLRRVLGVQAYQTAAENSKVLEKRIERIAYGLGKASEDVEEKKSMLESMRKAMSELGESIPDLELRETEASAELSRAEDGLKALEARRVSLESYSKQTSILTNRVSELEREVAANKRRVTRLQAEMRDEVLPVISRFERAERPSRDLASLKAEADEGKARLASLQEKKRAIDMDVEERRGLLQAGVCPVCKQALPSGFKDQSAHMGEESRALASAIVSCSGLVSSLVDEVKYAEGFEELRKDHAYALKERAKVEEELAELENTLASSQAMLAKDKSDLEDAGSALRELSDLERKVATLGERLLAARAKERKAADAVVEAKTRLAETRRTAEGLATEVERKARDRAEGQRLNTYARWTSEFFRPAVELIERQTLAHAASRFNEQYQRYFASLVDDSDMAVRIDEDFTPVFEREGFAQDYDALSGGERTSMALAYRFALNSVVREDLAAQAELMILDEPTDGFSREQVLKMRSLLETLDSRQVILVSHESELESMADHIFKVEKMNGMSTVSTS